MSDLPARSVSADDLRPASPDLPPGTIAMIAGQHLNGGLMRALTAEFSRRGEVNAVEQRSVTVRPSNGEPYEIQAVRWSLALADSDDDYGSQLIVSLLEDAAEQLRAESGNTPASATDHNADPDDADLTVTVLPAQLRPDPVMLLLDVDSTLIDQEVIELLAAHAGRERDVAAVTERAMRGELDFAASLHERVATLAGLPESVLESAGEAITLTQGARQLTRVFRRRDWPVHVVSGGFSQVLAPLADELGLSGYRANDLGIVQHQLDGTVVGAVVDRAAKKEYLAEHSARHGLGPDNVVAVGDGANDLDMVRAAGVGVAFCAKPALAAKADLVISHRSLELVGLALGLD